MDNAHEGCDQLAAKYREFEAKLSRLGAAMNPGSELDIDLLGQSS